MTFKIGDCLIEADFTVLYNNLQLSGALYYCR